MKKPLENFNNLKTTYEFGEKTSYNDFHLGLDIIVPTGTPIKATDDGIVKSGFGEQGGVTCYFYPDSRSVVERHLHCHSIARTGRVKEGDLIAYTGNTGMSTDPHLHTDIWKDGFDFDKILDGNNKVDKQKAREVLIDPRIYYNSKKIKCKVLSTTGKHTRKLKEIRDWYFYKGDIEIEFNEEQVERDLHWKYNEIVDNNKVDLDNWKVERGHYANGYDIVANIMKEEDWRDGDSWGYMKGYRVLGRYIFFQMDSKEPRRFNDWLDHDQFAGTFRHEFAHIFYRMANTIDRTHRHDYKSKKGLVNIFQDFNASDLNVEKPRMLYRKMYKHTNRTEKPKYWKPKVGKLYKDTAGRFFFEYTSGTNGWKLLEEEEFDEKLKNNGGRCVIMSIGEANYIAKNKLGADLTKLNNSPRTIIERRVAKSTYQKFANAVAGFTQKIPK